MDGSDSILTHPTMSDVATITYLVLNSKVTFTVYTPSRYTYKRDVKHVRDLFVSRAILANLVCVFVFFKYIFGTLLRILGCSELLAVANNIQQPVCLSVYFSQLSHLSALGRNIRSLRYLERNSAN